MINDDLTNRELSTEELEAIAAGWSLGGILHSVEHGLSTALHDVASVIGTIGKYIKIGPDRPWETGKSL